VGSNAGGELGVGVSVTSGAKVEAPGAAVEPVVVVTVAPVAVAVVAAVPIVVGGTGTTPVMVEAPPSDVVAFEVVVELPFSALLLAVGVWTVVVATVALAVVAVMLVALAPLASVVEVIIVMLPSGALVVTLVAVEVVVDVAIVTHGAHTPSGAEITS
jgi:hypothetical protein